MTRRPSRRVGDTSLSISPSPLADFKIFCKALDTLPAVDANAMVKQDATGRPLTPLIQAILNERRKEFYLENGDRWFELKRNGRPEWWVADQGMKYWTRKYMYTWPINVMDITLQPGLVQNPGYDDIY